MHVSSAADSFKHASRGGVRFMLTRSRAGFARARRSVVPAAQMTASGVGAYLIAEQLLGHHQPIFAAVAALVAMGFTKEPRGRKVIEVAAGCTLGVFIADMLVHFFGQGWLVAVGVVFLAVMIARFLDSGATFAMQMGLQALLVVVLPAPEDTALGVFSRSADAMVGGATALTIALLTPKDPRSEPVRELKGVTGDLTRALRETAAAVRDGDSREGWHALIRARGTQPKIDEVTKAVTTAQELTRYSPAHRRHRHYIRRIERTADKLDLAVRSLRVVVRRSISSIDHAALDTAGAENLARLLDELADGTALLSRAVAESGPGFDRGMEAAAKSLAVVAAQLHPQRLGIHNLEGDTIVLLIRTMVVDLLEATGMEHDEADAHLPVLG
ncbi:FUSC family protein [Nesterenkonia populi]